MAAQTSEEALLEFETAMNDFETMFPELDRAKIEMVLRKNDGSVAETIDELLLLESLEKHTITPPAPQNTPRPQSATKYRSVSHDLRDTYAQAHMYNDAMLYASGSGSSSAARSITRPGTISGRRHQSHRERLSADELYRESAMIRQKLNENEQKLDTVCDEKEARLLEDEQIALVLQNREFVRYMKRDPHLMKEVFGGTHVRASPQNRNRSVPRYSSREEQVVPEGPVIDGLVLNSKRGWSQRLKEKFSKHPSGDQGPPVAQGPLIGRTTGSEAFEDPFPYSYTVANNNSGGGEFAGKLKNMSKASKQRLSQLAKSFRRDEGNQATAYPGAM